MRFGTAAQAAAPSVSPAVCKVSGAFVMRGDDRWRVYADPQFRDAAANAWRRCP
jgi:hypothetical protein